MMMLPNAQIGHARGTALIITWNVTWKDSVSTAAAGVGNLLLQQGPTIIVWVNNPPIQSQPDGGFLNTIEHVN